jgi:hypothetical protein
VVGRAFPEHPPYGGVFGDVVPHLPIGEHHAGSPEELRSAELAVSQLVPITAHVQIALLLTGSPAPSTWHVVQELSLGRVPEVRDRESGSALPG